MVRRHLNDKQKAALECIAALGTLPPTCAPARQLMQATLSHLKREKLLVINDRGLYAVTDAGRAALESGMYDKQPHLLIMPAAVKTADAGRTAHMTYTGPGKSA